jgi:hypothetical protein
MHGKRASEGSAQVTKVGAAETQMICLACCMGQADVTGVQCLMQRRGSLGAELLCS